MLNKVYKSYKFRLYPTKEQAIFFEKSFGCSRFVYNHFLVMWEESYKTTGKGLSYFSCNKLLPLMKKDSETCWLGEVEAKSLQEALMNLDKAYKRFVKKQGDRPKFKKKNSRQSFTIPVQSNLVRLVDDKHIKIPKINQPVKIKVHREINGIIKRATISKSSTGKYYVSLMCEEDVETLPKTSSSVGIDLGLSKFVSLSDGSSVNTPYYFKQMQDKLAKEQRKLSRRALDAKKRGIPLEEAKNYQKQKLKVAKIYEKIGNQRTDFLQKLSTDVIKNHDIICIETLNVKGLVKNRRLAKSISDVSWSSFTEMLQYKANWYGKQVIKVDTWYPSSQICSCCNVKDGKKPLNIRKWTCPNCGEELERDINASINILNEGLRILNQ